MSSSFLFVLPGIVGFLAVYLSDLEKAKSHVYRIFIPWIPIFAFLVITLAFQIEGWACWVMILPVFLIMASLGGMLGGYLKVQKRSNKLNVSLLVLLPLVISPIESLIHTIPATYTANTYIDINASAEKIWNEVTRVGEISEVEDKGFLTNFLGLPRPVKAELNYEGIGASREAIFTNGLVFNETVSEYVNNKRMVFSIQANTHDIPSTTLDKHILIGGDYFDVLDGKYELEKLENGKHRLHLSSRFKMNTTFNFYAGWIGKFIMKDIQNNILQVEKSRAENADK